MGWLISCGALDILLHRLHVKLVKIQASEEDPLRPRSRTGPTERNAEGGERLQQAERLKPQR
jgi:hypothetical protein